MEGQTLSELWRSLDVSARANLLQLVADELFIGVDTFHAWRRGSRKVPQAKQSRLEAIIKKQYGVKIKLYN